MQARFRQDPEGPGRAPCPEARRGDRSCANWAEEEEAGRCRGAQNVPPPLKAKGCAMPAAGTLSRRREHVLFARSVPGMQTAGGASSAMASVNANEATAIVT